MCMMMQSIICKSCTYTVHENDGFASSNRSYELIQNQKKMRVNANSMLCCWFTTLFTITILCLVGVVRKDSRRTTKRRRQSVVAIERPPLQRAFVRGERRDSDIETLIEMLEVKCETMDNGFGDAIDIVTQAMYDDIDPQRDAALVTRLKRRVATGSVETCAERLNAKSQYKRLLDAVAELYYESVHYRSSIYFLHISKSGGTAMCDLACRNGC